MNTSKFSIPTPCRENWNSMTPDAEGRFCSQCSKTVVDFTKMTNSEIENHLQANSSNSVCGRFKTEQLQPQKRNARIALASLIMSVSATLVSCNKKFTDEGLPLDKIAYSKDAIIEPAIDSSEFIMGDIPIDSLHPVKLPPPPPVEELKKKGNK